MRNTFRIIGKILCWGLLGIIMLPSVLFVVIFYGSLIYAAFS